MTQEAEDYLRYYALGQKHAKRGTYLNFHVSEVNRTAYNHGYFVTRKIHPCKPDKILPSLLTVGILGILAYALYITIPHY